MPRYLHKESWWIGLLMLSFIVVRSLFFVEALNFATDQAFFSSRALEIWQTRDITLVGPTASFNTDGRYLIQSSVIYYTQLVFLLLGNFDPIAASYMFMLVAAVLIWPLFIGVKKLASVPAAILVTGSYAFLPLYVTYTRFLWNPNFQLAFLPLLIFSLGKYLESRRLTWLAISGFVAGWIALYHYQFWLVLVGLGGWLLLKKVTSQEVLIWTSGVVLGYSPLWLFELHSRFYLTQTLLVWWQSPSVGNLSGGSFPTHYFLSLSFLALVVAVVWFAKRRPGLLTISRSWHMVVVMAVISLILFSRTPSSGFQMVEHWSYPLEVKAHQLIAAQDLTNYAVVNAVYDTTAAVQYYLLEKHRTPGFSTDYVTNRYLFVIVDAQISTITDNPAYELNTFQPSEVVQSWSLSPHFSLYLLERQLES